MTDSKNPENERLKKIAYWFIIIAAILVILIYFQKFLKPFILALVFWYFIKEIRKLLGKVKLKGKRMPRWLRGSIALILMFVLIGSIGELLVSNLEKIIDRLPQLNRIGDNLINELGQNLGMEDLVSQIEQRLADINIGRLMTNLVNSLSSTIGNMVMIAIYLVFLLIEEFIFAGKIKIMAETKEKYRHIQSLLEQIDQSISRYILMKTLISLSTGIISYIILIIWGVDYAIIWAFAIFLFNYIPYVGSLVATLLPAIFAIFQFNSGWYFVYIFLTIEAVQILHGNYIEPRVMGRSLNLSPLVVVLSLTIWGSIWGILGMILSVPIMSVLTIIMAQFPDTRKLAIFLSETGDIQSFILKNGDKELY
jgi:predicted PurR-regulated permease PerM